MNHDTFFADFQSGLVAFFKCLVIDEDKAMAGHATDAAKFDFLNPSGFRQIGFLRLVRDKRSDALARFRNLIGIHFQDRRVTDGIS